MRILSSCIAIAAASQLAATDCGNVTRDPGFDLWCGDILCAWKIERGEVRRVPTWHPDDSGVELVEPDTAIEQFTPVDHRDGTCIRFDLISDVAENADVALAIDVYGDGTLERSFAIPTAHWKPVSFAFAVTPPFTGVRFEITKRGGGRAVVARMRAAVDPEGCDGVAPIDGGPAPLGALCDVASDCASAICPLDFFGTGHCAGCDPAKQACGAGMVCGLTDPGPAERVVPLACVAARARALGEQCAGNGECATGICMFGVCSACFADAMCGGAACAPSYERGPHLCDAGQKRGARGAACARDADCASESCTGPARQQCNDGRACANDANCPVDPSLAPTPCETTGIQGGTCD